MTRIAKTIAILAVTLVSAPAWAAPQVLEYQVEHPTYGNIGTYVNTITPNGDSTDVQTELHIGVKVLGISMFHQDASRVEHWQKDRLVGFQGKTDDNGTKIDVNGQAQADSFVVTNPQGTVHAPARVHPSNPWSLMVLQTDTMMGTKNGKITTVKVTDTGEQNVTFDGQSLKVHQFFIDDDKHQIVWFGPDNTVVGFQTTENGSQITFVLKQVAQAASNRTARTGAQPDRAGQ